MGRSVSTPSNAVEVLYLDWMPDEDTLNEMIEEGEYEFECRHHRQSFIDENLIPWEWDYVIEDFRDNVLKDLFPSVDDADGWIGNEDRIIAENYLASFGVSEYCGLAALWVVPKDPDYYGPDTTPLALHWISQTWPKVEAMYPNRLALMGRFSNGEAVYRRVNAETETERNET